MSDDDLSDTHENEKSSCGEPPPKSAKFTPSNSGRSGLRTQSSKIGWFPQLMEKKNPHAKYAVNRYRLARPHFKDIVKLRYTRRQYQANKDRKTLFRVCDGRRKSAYTRKQQRLEHVPFLQSITSCSVWSILWCACWSQRRPQMVENSKYLMAFSCLQLDVLLYYKARSWVVFYEGSCRNLMRLVL